LFIDDNVVGGNSEEVVIVKSFSGTTVTLETPLAFNHSVGDNVQLMADVLTVDILSFDHDGQIKVAENQYLVPLIGGDWALGTKNVVGEANSRVAAVEEIREYVDVVDASLFPSTGGIAQVNFGRNIAPYESQLTADEAAGSGSVVVDDGSGFLTTNFYVQIGTGTRIIETILVSSRAGNTLTLSSNLLYTHRGGEWVRYFPGEREQVSFNSTETGGANERLVFTNGILFADNHLEGEPVALSGQQAVPSTTGTDYPFYLPSRWEDRIEFLIDLARAAGVRVLVTSDR